MYVYIYVYIYIYIYIYTHMYLLTRGLPAALQGGEWDPGAIRHR